MNPGISHLWMMIILCLLPALLIIFKQNRFHLPSAVNGILLIPLMIWLYHSDNDPAASASTASFLFFLIFPLLLQKKISENILNKNISRAKSQLLFLKFISPAFPAKECRRNISLLEKSYIEKVRPEELTSIKCSSIPSVSAAVQIHFLNADWDTSSQWLDRMEPKNIKRLPWLALLRIRIDSETGGLQRALEMTRQIKNEQSQLSYYIFHVICLTGFSGYRKGMEAVFNLEPNFPEKNRDFWLAVADFKNEQTRDDGRQTLQELLHSDEIRIARAAESVLSSQESAPVSRKELDLMLSELINNFEDYSVPERKPRVLTWLLAAVNLAVFFLTAKGQRLNDPVAEMLAMKLPEMIETGEYWRTLTTTFIHSGPLHFFSNMTMLIIFGLLIEPFYKTFRFLFIYLGAGIAGMAAVTLLSKTGQPTITVGASGCTMALLGAYIAVLLRQNRRSSIRIRKQQLFLLFCFILIQSRMDLISKQISFTAHIVGLVFGLITAYFLYEQKKTEVELEIGSVSETGK